MSEELAAKAAWGIKSRQHRAKIKVRMNPSQVMVSVKITYVEKDITPKGVRHKRKN
jgi:hypothetical protein